MLTEEQVDTYRTFGFVVLRDYLAAEETAALADEMDRAHRDAFGERLDDRPETRGMSGHYLPMMGERTPRSRALVEDSRFLGAARQLLGPAVLPQPAEGNRLYGFAGFHDDAADGVAGVKFVAYLDPLSATDAALRLLPGSHHPDFRAALYEWRPRHRAPDDASLQRQLAALPLVPVETQPGDVIAFSWHTFHANPGGRERRQWTVSYVRDPVTPAEVDRFRDIVVRDLADPYPGQYDQAAYPLFDACWLQPTGAGERASLSARMRELGMFDAV